MVTYVWRGTKERRKVCVNYNILDSKRKEALPDIARSGEGFYLAGGTALAFQIGHRDSIDFSFFKKETFDTLALFTHIQTVCSKRKVSKMQEEENTLSVLLDGEVQLSFFSYRYALLNDLIETDYMPLASIEDIACMKLSTIISRSTLKDYVDLYYILKQEPLSKLLASCVQKFPELDQNLILKSLVYFDDIVPVPIRFMSGYEVDHKTIQSFIVNEVKKL